MGRVNQIKCNVLLGIKSTSSKNKKIYSEVIFERNFEHKEESTCTPSKEKYLELIHRAAESEKIIQNILKDAGDNLFTAKQFAYLSGDLNTFTRKKALHQAVESRIHKLDQGFFVVLNAYIGLCMVIGAEDVSEIMFELKKNCY